MGTKKKNRHTSREGTSGGEDTSDGKRAWRLRVGAVRDVRGKKGLSMRERGKAVRRQRGKKESLTRI